MNCIKCDQPIPRERLEALPDTKTCTACSTTQAYLTLMEYGHKTAGALVVVRSDPEQQRMAKRAYRRAR